MSDLLSSFGKHGTVLGLNKVTVDIEDNKESSKYFDITEFSPVFTAGKNSVSFNGSNLLAPQSEIRIECLDSRGNSLFVESPPFSAHYVDMGKHTISVSIFAETINGPGTLILVGTVVDGRTVRWNANITINNSLANTSRTRFYDTPILEVRSLLFPVVNITTGSVLTNTININLDGKFKGQSVSPPTNTRISTTQNLQNIDYRLIGEPRFNFQQMGHNLIVMADSIYIDGKAINVNITESFTVKNIINSNTVQIDKPFTYADNWINYIGTIYTGGNIVVDIISATLTVNYVDTTEISSIAPIMGGSCNGTSLDQVGSLYLVNRPIPITDRYIITSTTAPFSSSMVGKTININSTQIARTTGYLNYAIEHSAKIVEVAPPSYNDYSVVIDVPFTYPQNEYNELVNITNATFTVTEQPLNIYQDYSASNGSGSIVQQSYAEIVYRNIKTFSGAVARHKLYAKSNIYPGDYVIVLDNVIGAYELLSDINTADKNYSSIGTFLTRDQVSRYWFTNNASSLAVIQNNSPIISSLYIASQPGQAYPDGTSYVICKTTIFNLKNDATYYPYDETQFSNFSGSGYASNFISLKANTFHELSTNIALQKDTNTPHAKVSFYFTSSTANITTETNYNSNFGVLLGEVSVSGSMDYKSFAETQVFRFTPLNDYYGTLVIVPYKCNVILSDLSLKNYGDYGFSPDTGYIRLPFPINVANEAYTLKAELYDINSNLIYSTAPIIHTFDKYGKSLYGNNILGSAGTSTPTTLPTLTVNGNFLLPNISTCGSGITNRILGINTTNGIVCATNITNISLISSPSSNTYKDYIEVDTANPSLTGRSLIIHYNGLASEGKRIVILADGTKITYS